MQHICHCWCIFYAKESSWWIYVMEYSTVNRVCVCTIYSTNLRNWDIRFDIVYTITDGLCRWRCEETNTINNKKKPARIQYAYLSSGKNSGNELVVEFVCMRDYDIPKWWKIGTYPKKPGKRLYVSQARWAERKKWKKLEKRKTKMKMKKAVYRILHVIVHLAKWMCFVRFILYFIHVRMWIIAKRTKQQTLFHYLTH